MTPPVPPLRLRLAIARSVNFLSSIKLRLKNNRLQSLPELTLKTLLSYWERQLRFPFLIRLEDLLRAFN